MLTDNLFCRTTQGCVLHQIFTTDALMHCEHNTCKLPPLGKCVNSTAVLNPNGILPQHCTKPSSSVTFITTTTVCCPPLLLSTDVCRRLLLHLGHFANRCPTGCGPCSLKGGAAGGRSSWVCSPGRSHKQCRRAGSAAPVLQLVALLQPQPQQ